MPKRQPPFVHPEQLDQRWLKQHFDHGSWQRGCRYFKDNRAEVTRFSRLEDGSVELIGQCQGSAPRPYRQEITIEPTSHGPILFGECSCPVAIDCKHVLAVTLAWLDKPHAQPSDPMRSIDAWLAKLSEPQSVSKAPGREGLLYLLDFDEAEAGVLETTFALSKIGKEGQWTRGRFISPQTLHSPWSRPRYLDARDENILSLLRASTPIPSPSYPLTGASGHLALARMVATGRCFLGSDRDEPIQTGPTRTLEFVWEARGHNYRASFDIPEGGVLLDLDPPAYLDLGQLLLGPLACPTGMDPMRIRALRQAPSIPAELAPSVSRRIARDVPTLPTPLAVEQTEISELPIPILEIDFDPRVYQAAEARLSFSYGGHHVDPGDQQTIVRETETGLARIHRDLGAEMEARQQLAALELTAIADQVHHYRLAGWREGMALRDAWFAWIDQHKPLLEQKGWKVELVEQQGLTISRASDISGEIEESGNDWFSLRFDLEFDGWVMPLLPMVSELLEHYSPGELPETLYLNAGDGHFVSVPSARIEPILAVIIDLFDRIDGEILQLPRPEAATLNDLDGIPIEGATSLQKLAAQLRDFSGLRPVKLPSTFKGTLRDYQQQGLNWLQFLREHGFGGILADDMGLGKTIQTLAHLAVEKRSGRMRHPCLIVAPTSLMSNWQREAAQFTPGLKVLILQGPERFGRFKDIAQANIVLTTYPLLPRDRDELLDREWHYLVLDEAQQIKNPKAQAAQVVRHLKARHRVCLTGTPMENHLGELWAQFDFLMPGFLGDQQNFRRNYRTPIEQHADGDKLTRLTRRTAPFLLRRTKDRVADELPPKTDMVRTVAMQERQALLYESIRLTMEKKVRQSVASRGLARSHIIVLDALLKLRQVCCDPRLLPAGTPGVRAAGSAKFSLLFDLLPELLAEGRRILLFSQFTSMLGLIEQEVKNRGIVYSKLTGQTRKRDAAIERFRSGQADLFLISLKAGGVGLNLTEADAVIHYDPWWNPAVEHQATDRAHRIGQDKRVFVYKLVAEGTVEERILDLQARKQRIADQVYGKTRSRDEPAIDEATIEALMAAV